MYRPGAGRLPHRVDIAPAYRPEKASSLDPGFIWSKIQTDTEMAPLTAPTSASTRRLPSGMARVWFGAHDTIEDYDEPAQALNQSASTGYRGRLCQYWVSEEYSAIGWSPDLVHFFRLSSAS